MAEIDRIKNELAATRALVVALAVGLIADSPERRTWSLGAIDRALDGALSPQYREALIRLREDIGKGLEDVLISRN